MLMGLVFSIPGARFPAKSGIHNLSMPVAQIQPPNEIQEFSPLSASSGWVRMDSRLYFTSDDGSNWQDITPALPATADLLSASFLDPKTGWVLWSDPQANGNLDLQFSSTSDAGMTWESRLVQTILPDDPDSYIQSASMDWLDGSTGWISIKRQTGTNFSAGALFHTVDGGHSWTRSALPVGAPVRFSEAQVGWMAGGPANNQLFKSGNAGLTWVEQSLPADLQGSRISAVYAPIFDWRGKGFCRLSLLKRLVSTFIFTPAWMEAGNGVPTRFSSWAHKMAQSPYLCLIRERLSPLFPTATSSSR